METLSESEVINALVGVVNSDEIVEIRVEPGIKKGEGFLSVITKVDVVENARKHSFIVKSVPKNEQFCKYTPVKLCFQQEINFYKEVIPAFENFQRERNVKTMFCSVAKCLKTSPEYLIFENMKEQGYVLTDRRLEMDAEHISLVLAESARLHAISFALKDQQPEKFRELESYTQNLMNARNFPECFEAFVICGEKLSDLFDPVHEKELHEGVKGFAKSIPAFFEWFENDKNERKIIVHGDCWPNNILFKYANPDKPTTPTDLCFVDFQLLRLSSPIIDISYFLSLSAPKHILDDLNNYLRVYYISFERHLRELGSDPEKLYPFSALKQDWKTYFKYGFILGLTFLRSTVRSDDEMLDYTDLNASFKFSDLFLRESKSCEDINRRLRNLIRHMYETGLL